MSRHGRAELQLSAGRRWVKTPNRYQGLMIRPAIIFLSAATAIFLTACESDQDQKPKSHKFGYTGDTPTEVGPAGENGAPPPQGDTTPDNGGPIAPPPPPPPSTQGQPASTGPGPNGTVGAPSKDYPYAVKVAGKPGFVTSPYAPYSGYVDVRGFPPGTEVKDPYTQKVFLVP